MPCAEEAGSRCPLGPVSAMQSHASQVDRAGKRELTNAWKARPTCSLGAPPVPLPFHSPHNPKPRPRPALIPGTLTSSLCHHCPHFAPFPPVSSCMTMSSPSRLGINCTLFHEAAYQTHSLYPLIKKAIKFVCSNLCCTHSWCFLIRLWGPLGAPRVEPFIWVP